MAILESEPATKPKIKRQDPEPKVQDLGPKVQDPEVQDPGPKPEPKPEVQDDEPKVQAIGKSIQDTIALGLPTPWANKTAESMKKLWDQYCKVEGIKDYDPYRLLMERVIARLESAGPDIRVEAIWSKL